MAVVYSYCRFSSSQQEQGTSVFRQKAMSDAWMLKHPKHTLDETLKLSDLGISAFNGANLDPDKGDLGKFIALVKQTNSPIAKGSILLLERLDRFSRQEPRKAYRVFCELIDAGMVIQTLDPEMTIDESNIDSIEVILPIIIYMTIAYEQSREKARRCSVAWSKRKQRARDEHLAIHKRCPSWLFIDANGAYQVKPEGKKAVKYIYDRTAQGIGQRVLVKELNAKFKPIHISGAWTLSTLGRILQDRSVIGEYQPHKFEQGKRIPDGEPIGNYYPSVIDEALFYQVQAVKDAKQKQKGPSSKFINLFTGLLYGKDGYALHVVSKSGKYRRLVSFGHIRGLPNACAKSLDYFQVENSILQDLTEISPKMLEPNNNGRIDLTKQQNEMDGLQARIGQLQEHITSTSKPLSTILEALGKLEARRDELGKQIEASRGKH